MASAASSRPGAPAGQADPQADRKQDLQRLKDIEQHVIEAVELAAGVLEALAELGPHLDRAVVQQRCEGVQAKLRAAQALVQEGVEHPIPEYPFQANEYRALVRATIAQEKLQVVMMQLDRMAHAADAAVLRLAEAADRDAAGS